MHVKYRLKNLDTGWIFSGVIDGDRKAEPQLEALFQIGSGNGIGVNLFPDRVELTDYFHASAMAEFTILSKEETTEPLSAKWGPHEQ